MHTLTQQYNWAATPIGGPEGWPQSLRTMLSVILNARFPMFLWWGPELIQFYNDAYRPSLGINGKHPTALGQRAETCWPETWPMIKPLIDQVMAGGEATWNEDQLIPIYRNGQLENVYWTYSYSPVRNEAGAIAGVLVICRDVTVDMRDKQQVEASEAYLQRIFTYTAVGIAILRGPDFIIELANPGVCILWGRTEADVLGKPLFEALPEVTGQGFEALLTNVMQTGQAFIGKELPATINRDGQLTAVYFDFVYEPLPNADGVIDRILITASDATERRHSRQQIEASEASLRLLFEQAPVAIAILRGPELTYELANKLYVDLIGRTSPDSLIGKPLLVALPELPGQGIDELLQDVMRTGNAFTATERSVIIRRNGQLETGYFNFVYEPLRETAQLEDGSPVSGVFVAVIDVTEQVLARQQADQLLERERELLDLKSNFVTLASHEFRTPMGTILSSAALIGRYDSPHDGEKRDRHVQRIKSAVHSLTGLLNDFLSLSQMEQANMHGRPYQFDIVVFCTEVIEDMQGVIKPGQRVVYQHLSGPSVISLDGQMLKNILINLLINASKYSADKKEIELTTTIRDGQLVVEVKDEGIGIPDADKDRLFISFFRARNAVHVGGTGLGLYVAKRYVDLLDGLITFTSEVDSGTIFTIQLPLSPVPL